MGTVIITSAILALATAIFVAFWDKIINWCIEFVRSVIEAFVTFVKVGYKVCAYLYRRRNDGWTRKEIEVEKIEIDECPLSVRKALFEHDAVIVKRY